MIKDNLSQQIKKAMKAGDQVRLSTLKMLSAALTNAEIAKKREELSPEEELQVVKSEAKKRKDAIEAYQQAGNQERANKEAAELKVLQEFLPAEISDNQLEKIIDSVVGQMGQVTMADMGKVMGAVMQKVSGRADGNKVNQLVRQRLQG